MNVWTALAWVAFFGAVCSMIAMGVLQFMNPDMTRTRLALTYWPVLVTCGAFIVLSAFAEFRSKRKST